MEREDTVCYSEKADIFFLLVLILTFLLNSYLYGCTPSVIYTEITYYDTVILQYLYLYFHFFYALEYLEIHFDAFCN